MDHDHKERSPIGCEFREPISDADFRWIASCRLVQQIGSLPSSRLSMVRRVECDACCHDLAPSVSAPNTVVRALVYQRAGVELTPAVPHPTHARESAKPLPQPKSRSIHDVTSRSPDMFIATGLVTASPTPSPIDRTLESLNTAGFESIHVFAESAARFPQSSEIHLATRPAPRLSHPINFLAALLSLSRMVPEADGYLLLEDDVEVADGLQPWLAEQLWPFGRAVVSLFTPRHEIMPFPGWHVGYPRYYRLFGSPALLFRRDALREFLADAWSMNRTQSAGVDRLVADWALKRGLGIAYHTPSLIRHIGSHSSIWRSRPGAQTFSHAVCAVEQIKNWQPPCPRPPRVGLVGYNNETGLGYQNHDIARHLKVNRWLMMKTPRGRHSLGRRGLRCRVVVTHPSSVRRVARRWLKGLDWLLFVEHPHEAALPGMARHCGVRVACVPNWEWIHPSLPWLKHVDLMLCPTVRAYLFIHSLNERLGFGWNMQYVPWPVDTGRFQFQRRSRCSRFLFVDGWGGGTAVYADGSPARPPRKGLEWIRDVAALAPHLRFIIYSQRSVLPHMTPNVELRSAPRDNRDLYREGDVCLQPSRWEGLGLQLLECQATGMPLVTTDAAPMNEYEPFRMIPVVRLDAVQLGLGQVIPAQIIDPRDLLAILDKLHDTNIEAASIAAHQFIQQHHSWEVAKPRIERHLVVH